MNAETYQTLAQRTSSGEDRIVNGCLGLIGESGEVVDVIKKWRFQSGANAEFPREKLIEECGDVLWYCVEVCTGIGVNFGETVNWLTHIHTGPLSERCLEDMVAGLAYKAAELFPMLMHTFHPLGVEEVSAAAHQVGRIVQNLDLILKRGCGAGIEDAMKNNVNKLLKRYPDGFDPARSLHREEGVP